MIRRTAAIVLALALAPALARAQDVVLTVSAPSANVHKGPSTATPVIGHASRDTVLPVSRNLGSWVMVPWPDAPDGVGYVHVTMGRIGQPAVSPSVARASQATAAAQVGSAPATTAAQPPARTTIDPRVATRGPQNALPASHSVGVGGLIGSTHTFGATARVWSNPHLGIQMGFTRESMTSDVDAGRVTTMQFEPGVVYGLVDRVSDHVWVRPYVGSVLSFGQQSLTTAALTTAEPASESGVGFRVFGGSEFMFASAPQLGLSVDLGYRRFPTPFPGFEPSALSLAIAGHWYVK